MDNKLENLIFDYESVVNSLGKFEHEPRYTPYFYECMLNGNGQIIDLPNGDIVTRFKIEQVDIDLFPELEKFRIVDLYIDDNGFVISKVYE